MKASTTVQPPALNRGRSLLVRHLAERVFEKLGPEFAGYAFLGGPLEYGMVEVSVREHLHIYLQRLAAMKKHREEPRVSHFILTDGKDSITSVGARTNWTAGLDWEHEDFSKSLRSALLHELVGLGILKTRGWQKQRRPSIPFVPFLMVHMPLTWLSEEKEPGSPKSKKGLPKVDAFCEFVAKDKGLPEEYRKRLTPPDFPRRFDQYKAHVWTINERRSVRLQQAQASMQLSVVTNVSLEIAIRFPQRTALLGQNADLASLKSRAADKIEKLRQEAQRHGFELQRPMKTVDKVRAALQLAEVAIRLTGKQVHKPSASDRLRAMGIGH